MRCLKLLVYCVATLGQSSDPNSGQDFGWLFSIAIFDGQDHVQISGHVKRNFNPWLLATCLEMTGLVPVILWNQRWESLNLYVRTNNLAMTPFTDFIQCNDCAIGLNCQGAQSLVFVQLNYFCSIPWANKLNNFGCGLPYGPQKNPVYGWDQLRVSQEHFTHPICSSLFVAYGIMLFQWVEWLCFSIRYYTLAPSPNHSFDQWGIV